MVKKFLFCETLNESLYNLPINKRLIWKVCNSINNIKRKPFTAVHSCTIYFHPFISVISYFSYWPDIRTKKNTWKCKYVNVYYEKLFSIRIFSHVVVANNAGFFDKTKVFLSISKFIPHSSQVLVTYLDRKPDSVLESFWMSFLHNVRSPAIRYRNLIRTF
jgi:hypothetical protein